MAYQSLPWQQGDSQSFAKLISLSLPSLKGKSLLDVGCNTGYFCGWAVFDKATKVMGIDNNPEAIASAKSWFQGCSFSCMSWEDLSSDKFDVILCLSAIHYADDQKALIDTLMQRVSPGGTLVLELGVAPGEEDKFEEVKRSIDSRFFPTQKKLNSMLGDYAFKPVGASVLQVGDPIPRSVYHIRHKLPVAVLLMDEHYSGKTTFVRDVIKPELLHIQGDSVYTSIISGDLQVSDLLKQKIQADPLLERLNFARISGDICDAGLVLELADVFISLADGKSVVIDHYIPVGFRNAFAEAFDNAGFFVANVSNVQAEEGRWFRKYVPHSQHKTYARYLEKMGLINEAAYLEANPDVAQAIADEKMPNAQYHYNYFGRHEGRKLQK